MKTNHSTVTPPDATRSPDALFNAPGWATMLLTTAGILGVLAIVTLVVGVWLATITDNSAPLGICFVLASLLGFPAWILQHFTRKSIGEIYGAKQAPAQTGPEQTVILLPRDIAIGNKRVDWNETEPDRVTVNAPRDEVGRMMAYLTAHPTAISRRKVMAGAKVKQSTYEAVMAALEKMKVVANGGKSGYTVTDSLDAKLDRLDARF